MKTDANGRHHMRRQDRAMPDRAEQLDVIRGSRFLTLAMSRDNQPYLVSLCYAFDERENCFYAHGATAGKKLEYVRANPRVWGQVLDDGGYAPGKATYYYRTVMFDALAEVVDDPETKARALRTLIERYEPAAGAGPMAARMVVQAMVDRTAVLRLRVLAMTGKQNRPEASPAAPPSPEA
ncbi:MAG TPA: pyridoxamine 5'-phosphate oxidase family protein [Planctomycetota bacterium]|nr:pyridoxamine 5'-phosphate oxidase family protein [Planctomycetota bacterium]